MPHIDPTPSTFDVLPRIAGGQDDRVLDCLQVARERIEKDWTASAYITPDGSVCAYGGTLVAVWGDQPEGFEGRMTRDFFDPDAWGLKSEQDAARVAMEAIDLVNDAAMDLFPEWSTRDSGYLGPVEVVNQLTSAEIERHPDEYDERAGFDPTFAGNDEEDSNTHRYRTQAEASKLRVLACYDEAIRRRAGQPVHA